MTIVLPITGNANPEMGVAGVADISVSCVGSSGCGMSYLAVTGISLSELLAGGADHRCTSCNNRRIWNRQLGVDYATNIAVGHAENAR